MLFKSMIRVLTEWISHFSRLGFLLLLFVSFEVISGSLLLLVYSPSVASAWGSVYYLNEVIELGWFVRGSHRIAAYGSVILGGLWVSRMILVASYRRGRAIAYWLALGIVGVIAALGITGNILPWDQRGYWAAVVETTIAGSLPVIGPTVRRMVVGGLEIGNATLTRIHALHVVILPGLLVGLGMLRSRLLSARLVEETPSEISAESHRVNDRCLFGSMALLLVVGIVWWNHGYTLDAPADVSSEDYPARPEWYFLPLYRLLRVFEGQELLATAVIPSLVIVGFLSLPLLDRILPAKLARIGATTFLLTSITFFAILYSQAIAKDLRDPAFHRARFKADELSRRAILLASRDGIPGEGAAYLLKQDPSTRGAEIFAKKCLGCHNLDGVKTAEQWAPAIKGFGSRGWIRGLLEKPDSDAYFGKAEQCSGMTEWKENSTLDAGQLDKVADYVALFAETPVDMTPGEWMDNPKVKEHPGRILYQKECAECHTFGDPSIRDKKLQPAPDMFAWGSDRWAARVIKNANSPHLYGFLGGDQKMPGFDDQLTSRDLSVLIRYLKVMDDSDVASNGDRPKTSPGLPEKREQKSSTKQP